MTEQQIKDEIVKETRLMRQYQKEFFSGRDREVLSKSKKSEQRVDSLYRLLDAPKNLFS